MEKQDLHYDTSGRKKKNGKGCLITVIVAFSFLCLCIVLPLTMGVPETKTGLTDNVVQIMNVCQVTEDQAVVIDTVLQECELIEIEEIEYDDMLDDMYNGGDRGYRIQSQGVNNIILYLDADKNVVAVRHADVDMYSEGTTKMKLSSFYLTHSQEAKLQIAVQNGVKSILKSPATAKFPIGTEWKFYKDYTTNTVTVASYVDSQNGFGAIIRADFVVVYEITGKIEDGQFELVYFEFDNEIVVDNR